MGETIDEVHVQGEGRLSFTFRTMDWREMNLIGRKLYSWKLYRVSTGLAISLTSSLI